MFGLVVDLVSFALHCTASAAVNGTIEAASFSAKQAGALIITVSSWVTPIIVKGAYDLATGQTGFFSRQAPAPLAIMPPPENQKVKPE